MNEELRLKCLEIAKQFSNTNDELLDNAEKIFNYIKQLK